MAETPAQAVPDPDAVHADAGLGVGQVVATHHIDPAVGVLVATRGTLMMEEPQALLPREEAAEALLRHFLEVFAFDPPSRRA